MDEPLANLDAKLRVHMRTELARLHKELETTTVYVTHDQEEAMTMSDRIAIINDGELQQIAPPLECYDQPTNLFVAGFIGSPAMNFLDAEVRGGAIQGEAFDIDIDESRLADLEEDQAVVVGIRPSDVYRASDAGDIANPTDPFTAVTDVIEPVGDETYVYMFVDGDGDNSAVTVDDDDEILMKIDPYAPISEDERIELVFDRDRVHLFDAETEEALFHGLDTRTEQVASRPDHH
jgi:multiple sugar transport system ATP-binding protein